MNYPYKIIYNLTNGSKLTYIIDQHETGFIYYKVDEIVFDIPKDRERPFRDAIRDTLIDASEKSNNGISFDNITIMEKEIYSTLVLSNNTCIIDLGDGMVDEFDPTKLKFSWKQSADQPNIITAPIEPGYITFWSDWDKFESIKLLVFNVEQGVFANQFEDEPDCFQTGTVSLIKRSGVYTFKALGRGT